MLKRSLIFGLGLIGMQPIFAEDFKLCKNTEAGRPIFIDGKMICTIDLDKDSTEVEGGLGLIDRMELNSNLNFVTMPAQNIGASLLNLQLSPISIQGQIYPAKKKLPDGTLVDQAPLPINSFILSPRISVSGRGICDLSLNEVSLNVSTFDTGFTSWIDKLFQDFLNKNPQLLAFVQKQITEGLAGIKTNSCDESVGAIGSDSILEDDRWDQIRAKRDLYIELGSDLVDEQGWMKDTVCDGLLYNSLYAIGGGSPDILAAEYPPNSGRFRRHHTVNCFDEILNEKGEYKSSSTISRDMMSGLQQFLLANSDNEAAKSAVARLVEYGQQHSFQGFPLIWIMGDGDIGRVDMPPGQVVNFYKLNKKLNGVDSPYSGFSTEIYDTCSGYVCHLAVLGILFGYQIDGSISQSALDYLASLANRVPENGLFNIAYGKIARSKFHIDRGIRSLLNEQYFPSTRLPTNHDRCDEYIYSREYFEKDGTISHDWAPCLDRPLHVFSGTDFLFATHVLLNVN